MTFGAVMAGAGEMRTRNGVALREILRCPTCLEGSVDLDESAATCRACHAVFAVRNGIPVMLDPDFSKDLLAALSGTRSWEDYDSAGVGTRVSRHSTKSPTIWQHLSPSLRVQVGPRFREFLEKYAITGLVLEIGGGPNALEIPGAVNVDVNAYRGVDVIGDARRLPFRDGVFQGLISNSVLEHIWDAPMVADECYRVATAKGFIFMCVPQVCGRHHTIDFCRWTIPGLGKLFARFTIIDSGVILGPAMFLHQVVGSILTSVVRPAVLAKLLVLIAEWVLLPIRFLDRFGRNTEAQQNFAHTIYVVGQKNVG